MHGIQKYGNYTERDNFLITFLKTSGEFLFCFVLDIVSLKLGDISGVKI